MTEKQKIFADEYLIDLNATRAYKVAYPRVKNDEVAAAAATRLLRNVKVAAYISERMQERQKRTEVTQDRVIEELAAIAFAKATDFVQISHGNVILTDTFDPALTGLTVTYNGDAWTEGDNYTYDAATGTFATIAGQITVPAATYTQETDGTYTVTPGTTTVTVTGTV